MRDARDTLLHLIADNLPSYIVKFIHFDRNKPNALKLENNAINISFIEDSTAVALSTLLMSIDLIYDDELTAVDAANEIRMLMQMSASVPKLKYAIDPQNPIPTGDNLYWNPNTVRFKSIASPFYFHLNCTLSVRHHAN